MAERASCLSPSLFLSCVTPFVFIWEKGERVTASSDLIADEKEGKGSRRGKCKNERERRRTKENGRKNRRKETG